MRERNSSVTIGEFVEFVIKIFEARLFRVCRKLRKQPETRACVVNCSLLINYIRGRFFNVRFLDFCRT